MRLWLQVLVYMPRQTQSNVMSQLQLLLVCALLISFDYNTWQTLAKYLSQRKKRFRLEKRHLTNDALWEALRAYSSLDPMDPSCEQLIRNPLPSHVSIWSDAVQVSLSCQMYLHVLALNRDRGLAPDMRQLVEMRRTQLEDLMRKVPETIQAQVRAKQETQFSKEWFYRWRKKWKMSIGRLSAKAWMSPEVKAMRVTRRTPRS